MVLEKGSLFNTTVVLKKCNKTQLKRLQEQEKDKTLEKFKQQCKKQTSKQIKKFIISLPINRLINNLKTHKPALDDYDSFEYKQLLLKKSQTNYFNFTEEIEEDLTQSKTEINEHNTSSTNQLNVDECVYSNNLSDSENKVNSKNSNNFYIDSESESESYSESDHESESESYSESDQESDHSTNNSINSCSEVETESKYYDSNTSVIPEPELSISDNNGACGFGNPGDEEQYFVSQHILDLKLKSTLSEEDILKSENYLLSEVKMYRLQKKDIVDKLKKAYKEIPNSRFNNDYYVQKGIVTGEYYEDVKKNGKFIRCLTKNCKRNSVYYKLNDVVKQSLQCFYHYKYSKYSRKYRNKLELDRNEFFKEKAENIKQVCKKYIPFFYEPKLFQIREKVVCSQQSCSKFATTFCTRCSLCYISYRISKNFIPQQFTTSTTEENEDEKLLLKHLEIFKLKISDFKFDRKNICQRKLIIKSREKSFDCKNITCKLINKNNELESYENNVCQMSCLCIYCYLFYFNYLYEMKQVELKKTN